MMGESPMRPYILFVRPPVLVPAVDLKELHATIGQLVLKNDFLAGALDKIVSSSAKH